MKQIVDLLDFPLCVVFNYDASEELPVLFESVHAVDSEYKPVGPNILHLLAGLLIQVGEVGIPVLNLVKDNVEKEMSIGRNSPEPVSR